MLHVHEHGQVRAMTVRVCRRVHASGTIPPMHTRGMAKKVLLHSFLSPVFSDHDSLACAHCLCKSRRHTHKEKQAIAPLASTRVNDDNKADGLR
jgi:hypothetical protein